MNRRPIVSMDNNNFIDNNNYKSTQVRGTWVLVCLSLSLLICWILAVISIMSLSEILNKLAVPSERMIAVIVQNPDLKSKSYYEFYFFLNVTAIYFMGMVAGLFVSKFRHRPISVSDTMDAFGISLFSMLTFWNIFTFIPLPPEKGNKKKGNSNLTGSKKAPNSTSTGSEIDATGELFNYTSIRINIGSISDQFKKELLSFDLRVRDELTDNLGWINETTITDCQLSDTISYPLYLFIGISLLGILYLRKVFPGSMVVTKRSREFNTTFRNQE